MFYKISMIVVVLVLFSLGVLTQEASSDEPGAVSTIAQRIDAVYQDRYVISETTYRVMSNDDARHAYDILRRKDTSSARTFLDASRDSCEIRQNGEFIKDDFSCKK